MEKGGGEKVAHTSDQTSKWMPKNNQPTPTPHTRHERATSVFYEGHNNNNNENVPPTILSKCNTLVYDVKRMRNKPYTNSDSHFQEYDLWKKQNLERGGDGEIQSSEKRTEAVPSGAMSTDHHHHQQHYHHHHRNRGEADGPRQVKLAKKKKKGKKEVTIQEGKGRSMVHSPSCSDTPLSALGLFTDLSTAMEPNFHRVSRLHNDIANVGAHYLTKMDEVTSPLSSMAKRRIHHTSPTTNTRRQKSGNADSGNELENGVSGEMKQNDRMDEQCVLGKSQKDRGSNDNTAKVYHHMIPTMMSNKRYESAEEQSEDNGSQGSIGKIMNAFRQNSPPLDSSSVVKTRLLRCDTAPIMHGLKHVTGKEMEGLYAINANSPKRSLSRETSREARAIEEAQLINRSGSATYEMNSAERTNSNTLVYPLKKYSEDLSCSVISLSNTVSGCWDEENKPRCESNTPGDEKGSDKDRYAEDSTATNATTTIDNNYNDADNTKDAMKNVNSFTPEEECSCTASSKRLASSKVTSRGCSSALAETESLEWRKCTKPRVENPNESPLHVQHRRERIPVCLNGEPDSKELIGKHNPISVSFQYPTDDKAEIIDTHDSIECRKLSGTQARVHHPDDLRGTLLYLSSISQEQYTPIETDQFKDRQEMRSYPSSLETQTSLTSKQESQECVMNRLKVNAPFVVPMESEQGNSIQPHVLSYSPPRTSILSRCQRSDTLKDGVPSTKSVKARHDLTFFTATGCTTPPRILTPPPPSSFSILSTVVTPTLLDDRDATGFSTFNSRASCIRSFRLSLCDDGSTSPSECGVGIAFEQDSDIEMLKNKEMKLGVEMSIPTRGSNGKKLPEAHSNEEHKQQGDDDLSICVLRSPHAGIAVGVVDLAGVNNNSSKKQATPAVTLSTDTCNPHADQWGLEVPNLTMPSFSLSSASLAPARRRASPTSSRQIRDTDPLLQSGRRNNKRIHHREKEDAAHDKGDRWCPKRTPKTSVVVMLSDFTPAEGTRHQKRYSSRTRCTSGADDEDNIRHPVGFSEVGESGTMCTLTTAACPLLPSFSSYEGLEATPASTTTTTTTTNTNDNGNDHHQKDGCGGGGGRIEYPYRGSQRKEVKKRCKGSLFHGQVGTGRISNRVSPNALEAGASVECAGERLVWPSSPISISVTGVNSLPWSEYSW